MERARVFAAAQVLLALVLTFTTGPATAQPTTINLQHLSVADGLSQNSGLSIAQDSTGFIWIATEDGLNRFDGYDFTVFVADRDDPGAISNDHINDLLLDRDGILWIGTRSGLHRYHAETRSFTNYEPDQDNPHALPDAHVTTIHEDTSGKLWVGTELGGLARFRKASGDFDIFRHDPDDQKSLSDDHVRAISADPSGSLWVGTAAGLDRLDVVTGEFSHFVHQPENDSSLSDNHVQSLVNSRDGTLWVGTEAGLNRREAGTKGFQRLLADNPGGPINDNIHSLYEDRRSNLWVATAGGVSRWRNDSGFTHFVHNPATPSGLSGHDVRSIFEDRSGVIWIGYDGAGISKLSPLSMSFEQISFPADDNIGAIGPHVWAIAEDSRNQLWMGTEATGVSSYNRATGSWQRYPQFVDKPVGCIAEDQDGVIWVGTDASGLFQLRSESSRFERLLLGSELTDPFAEHGVFGMMVDHQNLLWLATNDGVYRLNADRSEFEHYAHDPGDPQSLTGPQVRNLFESRNGTIWVGTKRGLNRFDRKQNHFYRMGVNDGENPDLASTWIQTVYQAINGRFWVGTTTGLYSMDENGRNGHHYDRDSGLPNNTVYGILQDSRGRLWLSTNQGLAQLDPENDTFHLYGVQDGLQANEFNQGAYLRDRSGRMYFGGINGVSTFIPERIQLDSRPPQVVVTGLRLFNSPVEIATAEAPTPLSGDISMLDRIVLTHLDSVFTLDFAALHFADPKRNRYAYRLLGLSDDWIEATSRRRTATFTALRSGSYRFEVRASNSAGVWSAQPAAIAIRVLPPLWRSWWAYLIYMIVAGAGIAWVISAHKTKTRERARTQRAIAASEERLRLSIWGSGDELWDWDVENSMIHRMNVRDAGVPLPVSEFYDGVEAIRERVHPEDLSNLKKALADHLEGNTPFFEATCRLKNDLGGWIWVLERGQVVARNEFGKATRVTGTRKDITPLKEAEIALRELNEELEERVNHRTEALSKANDDLMDMVEQLQHTQTQLAEAEKMAALGNLVAGVAHEINTPVGVCVTAASHLLEQSRLTRKLDQQKKLSGAERSIFHQKFEDGAQLILQNLERATQMIGSFKQVAVDSSSEHCYRFDLKTFLKEAITSLQGRISRAGHRLVVQCPNDIPARSSPGALYQIICNMILNSLSYGFDGIEAGTISIIAEIADDRILLTYRDNGVGMESEVQKHIFEPFFTTRRGSGRSGLGMHIVYNLVTQTLRGSIRCESSPQHGTSFYIDFPRFVGAEEQQEMEQADDHDNDRGQAAL